MDEVGKQYYWAGYYRGRIDERESAAVVADKPVANRPPRVAAVDPKRPVKVTTLRLAQHRASDQG